MKRTLKLAALASALLLAAACSPKGPSLAPSTAEAPLPAATATAEPLPPETRACPDKPEAVALIVDPRLRAGISAAIRQFREDLCADGYTTIERSGGLTTAPELRAYLGALFAESEGKLAGATLIGDFPRAYQWVQLKSSNPSIPSTSEEVLSLRYYADLDGAFAASPGCRSAGGHRYSFDEHGGDVDWEIWISVLPRYTDVASSIEAVNRYLARNHAYRTGATSLPRGFLNVSEHYNATTQTEHNFFLKEMRDGQYAWTPFSDGANARLYFSSVTGGLSVDQGYQDLSAGAADFTVLAAHGYWGASGKLHIAWAESQPIRTFFFWSDGCAVGNLDQPRNFLTSVLYSPTSMVLVAKGTTNDSGGLGNNSNGFYGHNIATSLARGETFGRALLSHINVPLDLALVQLARVPLRDGDHPWRRDAAPQALDLRC